MADLRTIQGFGRRERFEIEVDGIKLTAYRGETIGAVLFAAGMTALRRTAKRGDRRSMYCGIGVCHDCRMIVDGKPNTRVCQTLATPGCRVETQIGAGHVEIDY